IGDNEGLEEIRERDRLLAIIIYANYRSGGVNFFTPSSFSQQLGFLNHKKGKIIRNHVHNPVPRNVLHTQEVLIIREGKLRVDLYGDNEKFIASRILKGGDIILLANGGHGFEGIEDIYNKEEKRGQNEKKKKKIYF